MSSDRFKPPLVSDSRFGRFRGRVRAPPRAFIIVPVATDRKRARRAAPAAAGSGEGAAAEAVAMSRSATDPPVELRGV
jgi:hypothetical protein